LLGPVPVLEVAPGHELTFTRLPYQPVRPLRYYENLS